MSNNTIIEVRDVVYFEEIIPFKSRISSDPSYTLYASDILSSSSAPPIDFEPRKSKRIKTLTSFSEDFFTYLVPSRKQYTLLNLHSEKKPLTVR